MNVEDFKSVIQFAIQKEKEAVEFYTECSTLSVQAGMKQAFLEMASEEKKHVQLLENFKPDPGKKTAHTPIEDLKISDYLVDKAFHPDMKYQDLLILAMKREEKANQMYTKLAQETQDAGVADLFALLANEESKHKRRLEQEYDEVVLREN